VLFGVGGLLLLTMAFYGRISKVTFPGGAALELASAVPPETQKKIAGQIGATSELSDQPDKAGLAYLSALSKVQAKMLEDALIAQEAGEPLAFTSPGDDYVEEATQEAINEVHP
jgi:hypothetical protein